MTGAPDDAVLDDAAVEAVLAHMNGDHAADSLTIVQAFGRPHATAAEMVGLDVHGGVWWVETPDEAGGEASELRVAWPAGEITGRSDVRREVVALHIAARERLGLPHHDRH